MHLYPVLPPVPQPMPKAAKVIQVLGILHLLPPQKMLPLVKQPHSPLRRNLVVPFLLKFLPHPKPLRVMKRAKGNGP